MINARGVLVVLIACSMWAFVFCQGEAKERKRWFHWSGEHVAWESKGDRIK